MERDSVRGGTSMSVKIFNFGIIHHEIHFWEVSISVENFILVLKEVQNVLGRTNTILNPGWM